ncbi:hypothetical protein [Psychromicrobium lacuslunae]|uniref:Spore-associated protein A n=1 Tax=Psychromicrobium lacuslunae TaxID=1618207 RepID=A0A0D4BYJ0_9MICC|nr:hypothetical protein [Psychromicrobium lacuslunae]AJT41166.1 hypothetical protein UM93_05915 [Psychromicrobium lacuslunae]
MTALLLLGAGAVMAAAPASAATHGIVVNQCYGVKEKTVRFTNSPAFVEIWRSTRDGVTACAMLYDNQAGSHSLRIVLTRPNGDYSSDSGTFAYYAGGVVQKNMAGKCATVSGTVSSAPFSFIACYN